YQRKLVAGISEFRALGRDSKVARQCKGQRSGDRRAVYCRDHRLVKASQHDHQLMHVLAHFEQRFHSVTSVARGVLKISTDVPAGTKPATSPRYDYSPHVVVITRIGKRGDDLMHHYLGVSVELCRSIQRYRRDSIFFRVDDFVKVHGCSM